MKKKLSVLLLGAMLTAAPYMSNAALSPGQRITVNGQNYIVMLEPDPEDPDEIEDLEDDAVKFVRNNRAAYNGGLPRTASGDAYTLQYDAPFDLGISALLCTGAIVAGKRARNRRKAATA